MIWTSNCSAALARSLGASRPRAFFLVTLPQIRFAVITGALLSFLTSFDEVIMALFVSGGANSTLTRNMFNALRDQIDPTIAAISTIMVLVTSVIQYAWTFFYLRLLEIEAPGIEVGPLFATAPAESPRLTLVESARSDEQESSRF